MANETPVELPPIGDEEDERITRAALSDPDNPPIAPGTRVLGPEEAAPKRERLKRAILATQRRLTAGQEAVTLHLAPEVVSHFDARTEEGQARINRTLLRAVADARREGA